MYAPVSLGNILTPPFTHIFADMVFVGIYAAAKPLSGLAKRRIQDMLCETLA
jgi:hypothetical protein